MTPRPDVAFVLSDTPWPPKSGGDLRNVSLARSLAAVGTLHPVLFPLRAEPDLDALPAGSRVHPARLDRLRARRFALRAAATINGRHPFLQQIEKSGGVECLVRDLDEMKAGVVVLTYPLLGPVPGAVQRPGRPVIVDLDTSRELVDSRRLRSATGAKERLLAALDLTVARRMEAPACAAADEVWVVSEIGAADLRRRYPGVHVRVVPNTIDVAAYGKYWSAKPAHEARFVFVGSLHYGPNAEAVLWLARKLLPLIRRRRPTAELTVIGRTGAPEVTAELATTPGIRLLLDAPDAWAAAADAGPLVVPLRSGGGSRFKILEAAASGVPIVSTRLGMEGLDLEPGRHYLEAAGADPFADALERLWSDSSRATSLRDEALAFTASHYDQSVGDRVVAQAISALLDAGDSR